MQPNPPRVANPVRLLDKGPSKGPLSPLPRLLVLVVLVAPALLLASTAGGLGVAQAQGAALTTEQKQEMKLHYERAQRAFDIAKYADAIDEYAKVYEISGNPAMLFNI